MKVTIVCVGKIKEKYLISAIDEYAKRLGKYVNLEIAEVPDEKAPENLSAAEEVLIKNKEGEKILKRIKHGDFVIVLAIKGRQISSEELAAYLSDKMVQGMSSVAFVIGGSLGLSEEVLARADFKLSFSKMTFPHQLMRVILLEQIYRSQRILFNEPYHK